MGGTHRPAFEAKQRRPVSWLRAQPLRLPGPTQWHLKGAWPDTVAGAAPVGPMGRRLPVSRGASPRTVSTDFWQVA